MSTASTTYRSPDAMTHTILPVVCEIIAKRVYNRQSIPAPVWAAVLSYWQHGHDTDSAHINMLRAVLFTSDEWVQARIRMDTGNTICSDITPRA